MKIGYIQKYNLELNPHLTEKFKFKETTYTRRISNKSDRIYSKMFRPLDYEDVECNTKMMKKDGLVIVSEPFFLDDVLREKAIRWVEWANNADPAEYDFFAKLEKEQDK